MQSPPTSAALNAAVETHLPTIRQLGEHSRDAIALPPGSDAVWAAEQKVLSLTAELGTACTEAGISLDDLLEAANRRIDAEASPFVLRRAA